MNKKGILEETLEQITEIKKDIEENASFILKSTLKEDFQSIVRNGLKEKVEETPEEFSSDEEPSDDLASDEEMPDDIDGEEIPADDEMDIATSDEVLPDEETEPGEPELIDLTDKSDDEVIQHFNLMNPTDEIEIIKTPTGIQINIGNEEAPAEEIPSDTEDFTTDDEMPVDTEELPDETGELPDEDNLDGDLENGEEDDEDDEDMVFEIDLGGDNDNTGINKDEATHSKAEKHMKNVEEDVDHVKSKTHMKHAETNNRIKELQESLVKTRQKLQALMAENKVKTQELENFNTLTEKFKGSEKDYKSAIKTLKTQLQEVALFTSNLTYAVKLMTENSTTKDEKLDILKRFDSAKTLTESREIYNNMETLFKSTKKDQTQIVEEKVIGAPKTSGSSLNESSTYKSPQLNRILDLMQKIQ